MVNNWARLKSHQNLQRWSASQSHCHSWASSTKAQRSLRSKWLESRLVSAPNCKISLHCSRRTHYCGRLTIWPCRSAALHQMSVTSWLQWRSKLNRWSSHLTPRLASQSMRSQSLIRVSSQWGADWTNCHGLVPNRRWTWRKGSSLMSPVAHRSLSKGALQASCKSWLSVCQVRDLMRTGRDLISWLNTSLNRFLKMLTTITKRRQKQIPRLMKL